MLRQKIISSFISLLMFLISASPAFAHAVVKPETAGVGSFTDFSLGVPSEKDLATVGIKLILPAGINSVTPIVKFGWKVEVINSQKQGQPDDDGNTNPIPEAIVWSGGSVPAHQKDFFMFSTQVPAEETELDWKIEQTYADGSVVSWSMSPDQQPKDDKGNPDYSKFGPYSKTMVINDLKDSPQSSNSADTIVQSSSLSNLPLVLSGLAVLLSAAALIVSYRKKSLT
jgi:uncharacterized protein YcnI